MSENKNVIQFSNKTLEIKLNFWPVSWPLSVNLLRLQNLFFSWHVRSAFSIFYAETKWTKVTSLEKQNALHKSLQLHGQPSILSLQVGREQTTKQEEEHLAFIHQGAKNTT